jgi:sortase A
MRPETRRLLLVLVNGLLISSLGALLLREPPPAYSEPAADNPIAAAAPVTTTTAPLLVTPLVTTPTTIGPVDVPADPYAAEEIRRIGSIEIPKIGMRQSLQEGITLRNIDLGPSHWPGTAMPGEVGNVVVAGHRVTHTKPFRNIDQLVPGDQVIFTVGNVRSVYKMTDNEIVTPKALDIVNPTPTATATLFACHPPGSARFRFVVRLVLVFSGPA